MITTNEACLRSLWCVESTDGAAPGNDDLEGSMINSLVHSSTIPLGRSGIGNLPKTWSEAFSWEDDVRLVQLADGDDAAVRHSQCCAPVPILDRGEIRAAAVNGTTLRAP